MLMIEAVHLERGTTLQHISSFRWRNTSTDNTGETSRAGMVDWIENKNGKAYVANGTQAVQVTVVHSDPPYLRSQPDETTNDNLLSLPRF